MTTAIFDLLAGLADVAVKEPAKRTQAKRRPTKVRA